MKSENHTKIPVILRRLGFPDRGSDSHDTLTPSLAAPLFGCTSVLLVGYAEIMGFLHLVNCMVRKTQPSHIYIYMIICVCTVCRHFILFKLVNGPCISVIIYVLQVIKLVGLKQLSHMQLTLRRCSIIPRNQRSNRYHHRSTETSTAATLVNERGCLSVQTLTTVDGRNSANQLIW